MGFVGAVKTCILKYAGFNGRASRSELWWFVVFGVLMQVLIFVYDGLVLGAVIIEPFTRMNPTSGSDMEVNGWRIYDKTYNAYIVFFLLLIPTFAASIRRLHDVGRSGFWILLVFAPQIFFFILGGLLTLADAPTLVIDIAALGSVLFPIMGFLVLLFWWVQPSEAGQNDFDSAPMSPHLQDELDCQ